MATEKNETTAKTTEATKLLDNREGREDVESSSKVALYQANASVKGTNDPDAELLPSKVVKPEPKNDLLALENAAVSGSGATAQFVNANIVQWNIATPYWAFLPGAAAVFNLIHACLENKHPQWQKDHAAAMKRYGMAVMGTQLVGVWSFNEWMLIQYWPGQIPENIRTIEALCVVPIAAVAMSLPLIFLKERKSLSKWQALPVKFQGCLSHRATKKIVNTIGQGLLANSNMGAILALVRGFNRLSTTNAFIITGCYAGTSMLIELLPKKVWSPIDWTKWTAEGVHVVVKAGSLGCATIFLAFAIASGITHDHIPNNTAPIVGCTIAIIVLPALALRLRTHIKNAKARKPLELVEVAVEPEASEAPEAPLITRNRNFLFGCCSKRENKVGEKQPLKPTAVEANRVKGADDALDNLPQQEHTNKSSRYCAIL